MKKANMISANAKRDTNKSSNNKAPYNWKIPFRMEVFAGFFNLSQLIVQTANALPGKVKPEISGGLVENTTQF